jgi:hypothetical protein
MIKLITQETIVVIILSFLERSSSFLLKYGVTRSYRNEGPMYFVPGRFCPTTYCNKLQSSSSNEADNKAMSFLKKIGKVGGAANRDLRFAIGVDEGPAGKTMSDGMKVNPKSHVVFISQYIELISHEKSQATLFLMIPCRN